MTEPATIDPKSTHYGAGGIELIDVIRAKLTPEQFVGYCLGNLLKYSGRMNWKGNESRDAEKAEVYARLLREATAEVESEPLPPIDYVDDHAPHEFDVDAVLEVTRVPS